MEIVYTEETLYVNIFDEINELLVSKIQNRVFKIIDDYDIDNIVLNIMNDKKYKTDAFDKFINNYRSKYNGKVKIN